MPSPFRRVAIIENPDSGQGTPRRKAALVRAIAVLRSAADIQHLVINGPGSGSVLARQAIVDGCDAVLVCGGDGTVHEVLQAMVGTGVALGVLPMGTANALACDLGLPRSPGSAVEVLLRSRRVDVPVGRMVLRHPDGEERARYFTVAAGVGADALLMARMDPVLKRRLGYVLYMVEAFRIWVSHRFPLFEAEFCADGQTRTVQMSQLLAVRVRNFGGVIGRLVPGATLHANQLNVVVFKTRSRVRYLLFLLAVLAKRHTFRREVELIAADSVDVRLLSGTSAGVLVEADGEVLGTLPVRIELAAETLTLLIPPGAEP